MNLIKLKEKISETGITQTKIASRLGISRQTVNAKLNNRASFTVVEANEITKILNLDNPQDIFFDV